MFPEKPTFRDSSLLISLPEKALKVVMFLLVKPHEKLKTRTVNFALCNFDLGSLQRAENIFTTVNTILDGISKQNDR